MVKKEYQSKGDASQRYHFYISRAEDLDRQAQKSYEIAAQYDEGDSDREKHIKEGDAFRKSAERSIHTAVRFGRIAQGKSPFRNLERKFSGAVAIIGLVGAIIFLSSNITGNVIGVNQLSSNLIGVVLFFVGLFGFFSWMQNGSQSNQT